MANARRLALFHHEPANGDDAIERILHETRRLEELTRGVQTLEVIAAYDGLEIEL
jgi:phosphoribosyl 1,2-cyclic phosphodiesterase